MSDVLRDSRNLLVGPSQGRSGHGRRRYDGVRALRRPPLSANSMSSGGRAEATEGAFRDTNAVFHRIIKQKTDNELARCIDIRVDKQQALCNAIASSSVLS